jgi:predicted nucleic acid-binding protein
MLDTNAISALLEDDEALHARIDAERTLYLPVIAIGEFRFGLLGSRLWERLTEKLTALIRDCVIFDVSEATTSHYAELRHALKVAGTPIPAKTYGSQPWLANMRCLFSAGMVIPITYRVSNG